MKLTFLDTPPEQIVLLSDIPIGEPFRFLDSGPCIMLGFNEEVHCFEFFRLCPSVVSSSYTNREVIPLDGELRYWRK